MTIWLKVRLGSADSLLINTLEEGVNVSVPVVVPLLVKVEVKVEVVVKVEVLVTVGSIVIVKGDFEGDSIGVFAGSSSEVGELLPSLPLLDFWHLVDLELLGDFGDLELTLFGAFAELPLFEDLKLLEI